MRQKESPPSLGQQAYERIRYKVVSLELMPGAIIDPAALQAELNLGSTPIREALKRLSLEKLVTIAPRRGIFVTDIGITDLQRLFEVRVVLESTAARLATQRGTCNHWERMEAVLANLSAGSAQSAEIETLITIDEGCHHLIYEAADNQFLRDTLATLYTLSLRLWYFALAQIGEMHDAVSEHVAILAAFRAGDADAAAQLLEQHIRAFQEEIQAVMLGAPPRNGQLQGKQGS